MIIVLVVKILQSVLFLQLTELTTHRFIQCCRVINAKVRLATNYTTVT